MVLTLDYRGCTFGSYEFTGRFIRSRSKFIEITEVDKKYYDKF